MFFAFRHAALTAGIEKGGGKCLCRFLNTLVMQGKGMLNAKMLNENQFLFGACH